MSSPMNWWEDALQRGVSFLTDWYFQGFIVMLSLIGAAAFPAHVWGFVIVWGILQIISAGNALLQAWRWRWRYVPMGILWQRALDKELRNYPEEYHALITIIFDTLEREYYRGSLQTPHLLPEEDRHVVCVWSNVIAIAEFSRGNWEVDWTLDAPNFVATPLEIPAEEIQGANTVMGKTKERET